ncbi:MAG TPA: diacylglycerol kinase [Gammaproteobacteria bacterium]|jgi:diacylglycerol kinase (ATP)
MGSKGQTGIRRIISAGFNSVAGLKAAWQGEAAFRQECVLLAVMFPAAFWVGGNAAEWSLLIGSGLIVLLTELLNTAVEATVDRVGTDHHSLSGQAKDLGSAAVLVSLLLLGVVWGMIAWQNFA